jgi:hypothetical protein
VCLFYCENSKDPRIWINHKWLRYITVHHEKEKLLLTFVTGSAVQHSAGPTVHNGTGETVQQRYKLSPIDHKDTV